ncbi:MAG: site-specific integrase [Muribaculaceae bacterium]
MIKVYLNFSVKIYKNENINKTTNVIKTEDNPIINSVTGTFLSIYAKEEIKHALETNSHSTARNYNTAVKSFLRFRNGIDISLNEIDRYVINDYQKWLKERVDMSTISCYMRSLRAIYNRAVERGITVQRNPFKKVFTGYPKTEKRSIGIDDVRKLQALKLKPGIFINMVRDIFILSIFLCGMPFIDIAFLRKSHIVNGYLTYNRHKTNQKISIKLEPCMMEIIDKYISNDRDYVFPIITKEDKAEAFKQYNGKLSYYNRTLKRLGEMAGINHKITSYVARHTWASVAFQSGVELPVISKAMGHTSTQTTLYYIKSVNDNQLYTANRNLINEIVKSA